MKQPALIITFICVISLIFLSAFIHEKFTRQANILDKEIKNNISDLSSFNVMAFNLQVFGLSKAKNDTLIDRYADIINDYEITFASEIRDESGEAASKLCASSLLANYSCYISSRAGLSNSKEQYLIIYNRVNDVKLVGVTDFNIFDNGLYARQMQRPPLEAWFEINGKNFTFITEHTSPSNVSSDLKILQNITDYYNHINAPKAIILGDLNADCDYFDHNSSFLLDGLWTWVIPDTADTTTGASDCAYDRIIANYGAEQHIITSGVRVEGIDGSLSDHYPVWVKLSA